MPVTTPTDAGFRMPAEWEPHAGCLMACLLDPNRNDRGAANLERLRSSRDAAGRAFVVDLVDPGKDATVPYANHYLADGAVIVPVAGRLVR